VSLQSKTENAFLTYLKGPTIGLPAPPLFNFYPSQTNNKNPRIPPAVTADCALIREYPIHTGNFKARIVLAVWHTADKTLLTDPNPEDEHAAQVSLVAAAMGHAWQTLCPLLSAAVAGFSCLSLQRTGEVPHEPDVRNFVTTMSFEATVCEAVIT
jgi:hypothetical protein